jgi:hypothetical protein
LSAVLLNSTGSGGGFMTTPAPPAGQRLSRGDA